MLSAGTVLQGRYRIVRQLGQGGMGAVYEAVDERLDTIVALKETLFADEKLRKQFEREARLLARLHHQALPRVSDHFNEGDGQFLVMQYIAGESLQALRVDGGAAANNFLMQFQADVLGVPVDRPRVVETTAMGAAFLAGMATGFWRSQDELARARRIDRRFRPRMAPEEREALYRGWQDAVARVRGRPAPA